MPDQREDVVECPVDHAGCHDQEMRDCWCEVHDCQIVDCPTYQLVSAWIAERDTTIARVTAERDEALGVIRLIHEEIKWLDGVSTIINESDAGRLALGETCQYGQPHACGDYHTAGQCVRFKTSEVGNG